MSTGDLRVNARLTGDDARRFRELQDREKWSTTDVIRETVREYHVRSSKPRKNAYQLLREKGLIGSMKGPRDLSSDTRKYVLEVLGRKEKGQGGKRK